MAAQFIHGETYALKGLRGKPCVADIMAEAMRRPGYGPHIAAPRGPVLVYGRPPSEVLPLVRGRVSQARDRNGRKLCETFAALLCVVVSVPHSPEEVENDEQFKIATTEFFEASIEFLKTECGERAVVCALIHTDEENLHIHIYVVPDLDPVTRTLSIESVWAPARAMGGLRRAGRTHKEINEAFRAEARQFQDRFHARVGAPAGFERTGPRRARLPRAVHLAQRDFEAKLEAEAARKLVTAIAEIERVAEERIAAARAEANVRIAAAEEKAAAGEARTADAEAFKRRIAMNARDVAEALKAQRIENALLKSKLALVEDAEPQPTL